MYSDDRQKPGTCQVMGRSYEIDIGATVVFTDAGRLGANLLTKENLAAELKRQNYPEAAIGKTHGGNLLRMMPPGSAMIMCSCPMIESE